MDPELLRSLSSEELAMLWDRPAMEPPAGVEPNFANPGGLHELGYIVIVVAGVLVTISVALRAVSRILLKRVDIEDGGYSPL
jgi:hypothetical protein